MNENPNSGQNWGPVPQQSGPRPTGPHPTGPQPTGPQPTGPQPPMGGPYPGYGQPGPGQQFPAGPTNQYAAPGGQASPSFLGTLPLPVKLALGSAVLGLIAFFMGFLAWVTVGSGIERDLDQWAESEGPNVGIPAFLTMVFTPGWFLLGLGAAGVFSFGFVAVKLRRFLPHVAALAVVCWLGLLACAVALPGFLSLGAGAIVALILGVFQTALIGGAAVLDGMNDER
ncbi:MAG: DUF5336 domain-containing protein [Gordonia sp. (in: high G+C Gram-positive bacteria)]|uniref:DUF5336 domain-containing protein n=1 Tax=Gordonia sp. (in: high G+C Gram-positive bacteria) TaxID=84139 RepID=UPI0039E4CF24